MQYRQRAPSWHDGAAMGCLRASGISLFENAQGNAASVLPGRAAATAWRIATPKSPAKTCDASTVSRRRQLGRSLSVPGRLIPMRSATRSSACTSIRDARLDATKAWIAAASPGVKTGSARPTARSNWTRSAARVSSAAALPSASNSPSEARSAMSAPSHQPASGARSWVEMQAAAAMGQVFGARKPSPSRSNHRTR